MDPLALKTVTRTQGNNRDLKNRTVTPRNYRFDFEEVDVLVRAFRRMVRGLEFDVCEMAFTTYLCARAHGKRFTALPVFLVRGFHHGAIIRNVHSDIREPIDLEGRRVGVNRGYTVTTGVWARGILQDEHGVDLNKVTWAPSGDEHVAEYRAPANVVPLEPGQDLAGLVARGVLDAAVGLTADHPDTAPLLADPAGAARAALRERGLFPINHLVVVRDNLLADHPDLAADVFAAFAEAKRRYVAGLRDGTISEPTATDRMYLEVLELTGADPLPYGIEPNRAVISQLIDHAVTQGILDVRPEPEALFAEPTRELRG